MQSTGSKPDEHHPIIVRSYRRPAIMDATTLYHLDSRKNETADADDGPHPVHPGSDLPWLNALAVVIRAAWIADRAFFAERTVGREAVLGTVDIAANAALAGVEPCDRGEGATDDGGRSSGRVHRDGHEPTPVRDGQRPSPCCIGAR